MYVTTEAGTDYPYKEHKYTPGVHVSHNDQFLCSVRCLIVFLLTIILSVLRFTDLITPLWYVQTFLNIQMYLSEFRNSLI